MLCPNDSTQNTLAARVTLKWCLIQEARSDIDTLDIKAVLYNLDWTVLSHRHPSRRIIRGVGAFLLFKVKFKNKFAKDTIKCWTKSVVTNKLLIPRVTQVQYEYNTHCDGIEGHRSNKYNSQSATEIYDDLKYIVEEGGKRHATNPRDD